MLTQPCVTQWYTEYFQGFERQRYRFVYSADDSLPLLIAVLLVGDTYIVLSSYLDLENH